MKILIELPSWLGDTVMATPAIENILKNHKNADVTFIGSSILVNLTQLIFEVPYSFLPIYYGHSQAI